ncbi:MAG TPA: transporter [Saprospiraceae bacterium]|nr:transporter [Saprospiraceae bacterium]
MRIMLLVYFLSFPFIIIGQDIGPLVSDRPDQSDGACVLPKKIFQVESGCVFQKSDYQHTTMLRYGLTHSTEVRLQFDQSMLDKRYTVLPTILSVKQRLIKQDGIIPTITFIGYGIYDRITVEDKKQNKYEGMALLAFQNDFSDLSGIEYNIGTNSAGTDLILTLLYAYRVHPKLNLFIEYFSEFANDAIPKHNIDGGALYQINDDFQVDVGIGIHVASIIETPFIKVGASYRFLSPSKIKPFFE